MEILHSCLSCTNSPHALISCLVGMNNQLMRERYLFLRGGAQYEKEKSHEKRWQEESRQKEKERWQEEEISHEKIPVASGVFYFY